MKRKSGLSKLNIALSVILVLVLVANVIIVATKQPPVVEAEATGGNEDAPVIDTFVEGTYGGVEFKTQEDVVNYYIECFNYTKTLTANYNENGETKTYYKLVGDETLSVENLLVEGKSNDIINNLVPGIVGQLFSGNVKGLSPSDNRDPALDTRNDGALDLTKCPLQVDDVLACNVVDNGDGTINITIQPKAAILSMPGEDAQGRLFNVLGDITSTVEQISVLSFSQGSISDNFVVNYQGGTGTVTIDTKTKEITAADFVMKVHIDVTHANVTVIKDKSASLDIVYSNHFPASDEYLLKTKNITRA